MLSKFYPHFVGYEEDLRQEMLVSLIKAIKRIKKGEIRSNQNYIITSLKGTAYKMAKKLITYDRATYYLEDLAIVNNSGSKMLEWQDLFDMGCFSYETILSSFTSFEERYMIMIIMEKTGYSKRKLREKLRCNWDYISELEHRTKEKLREIIKMHTGSRS